MAGTPSPASGLRWTAFAVGLALGLALGASGPAHPAGAQTAPPGQRPPFQSIRYEEDWSALRDPALRRTFWDRLKFIPLDSDGRHWLSVGGEARLQYERVDHPGFGRESADLGGYLGLRTALHGDLHLGERFRAFGQVLSGLQVGRAGGPRPTDVDTVDLHQAFAELDFPLSSLHRLGLRVGRQEVTFGSTRWVSVRDGPNLRRTFDAVRLSAAVARWRFDAWVSRPVVPSAQAFDNVRDSTRSFAGTYLATAIPALRGGVDLYGFRLARNPGGFAQGAAKETRYTLGARVWGRSGKFDHNSDAGWQWGEFGGAQVRAFVVVMDVGYTMGGAWTPRLGLRASMSSGDHDPADPALQSLNPHFPSAFVFSAPVGPVNLTNLHPTLDLHLSPRVTVTLDYNVFWRTRTGDGVYDAAGLPFAAAQNAGGHYLGSQPLVLVRWALGSHVRVGGMVGHFFAGPVLREAVAARDVNLLQVSLGLVF